MPIRMACRIAIWRRPQDNRRFREETQFYVALFDQLIELRVSYETINGNANGWFYDVMQSSWCIDSGFL